MADILDEAIVISAQDLHLQFESTIPEHLAATPDLASQIVALINILKGLNGAYMSDGLTPSKDTYCLDLFGRAIHFDSLLTVLCDLHAHQNRTRFDITHIWNRITGPLESEGSGGVVPSSDMKGFRNHIALVSAIIETFDFQISEFVKRDAENAIKCLSDMDSKGTSVFLAKAKLNGWSHITKQLEACSTESQLRIADLRALIVRLSNTTMASGAVAVPTSSATAPELQPLTNASSPTPLPQQGEPAVSVAQTKAPTSSGRRAPSRPGGSKNTRKTKSPIANGTDTRVLEGHTRDEEDAEERETSEPPALKRSKTKHVTSIDF
jgi:hypothetical protein